MINKIKITVFILFAFIGKFSFGQNYASIVPSTINVVWENLFKTTFSNTTLTKESGTTGTGKASSTNVLYGFNPKGGNVNYPIKGGFEYIYTGPRENKKIGFTSYNSQASPTSEIEYGFAFQPNGKVKALTIDTSITFNYNVNDKFNLYRFDGVLVYYINESPVLEFKVDMTENLILRSELTANNSSFQNVRVSFDTKKQLIAPIFNYTDHTAKMNIIGGFPPFTYSWDKQDKFPFPSEKIKDVQLSKGKHYLRVADAQQNVFERTYLMGDHVTWSNFHVSQSSNNVLSKLPSAVNWGAALSYESINFEDFVMLEYIANNDNEKKAFGLVYENTLFRKHTDLKTGFLLSKNNILQVIHDGNIVFTYEYFEGDALLFEYVGKGFSWKVNGNEIYIVDDKFTSNVKIGGLVTDNTTLGSVHSFVESNSTFKAIWDQEADLGKIEVDITRYAPQSGPFHYYISEEPVIPLTAQYQILKDSIFEGVLDSISFFEGNSAQLQQDAQNLNYTSSISLLKQHHFTNLENGRYHITVFDKMGNYVLGDYVSVLPNLEIVTNNGLLLNTNLITANKNNANASFNHYLEPELNSQIDFKLVNAAEKQLFGFSNAMDATNTILYGFRVNNNRLSLLVNGEIQQVRILVKNENILSIKQENFNIIYLLNEKEIFKTNRPKEINFETEVELSKKFQGVLVNITKFTKKKSYTFESKITHGTCDNKNGSVSFKVNRISWFQVFNTPTIFAYSIKDLSTNLIIHANLSGISINSNSTPSLPVGTYLLSGNVNGVTFSETIFIGIEGEFDQIENYLFGSLNSSLTKNAGEIASAIAINEFDMDNQNGWIRFNLKFDENSESSGNYFKIDGELGTNENPFNTSFIAVKSFETVLFVYYENGNFIGLQSYPYNGNIQIEVKVSNTYTFYSNYSIAPLVSFNRTLGEKGIFKSFTTTNNSGITDVIFSVPCKEDYNLYGLLEYKLDGYYHIMKNGKIMFEYDNEYVDSELKFNIYNAKNQKIFSENSFPSLEASFGKNYFTLDVTEDGNCLGKGFFVLETISSKNEKKYLRFFNDYNRCVVPIVDSPTE